MCDSIVSIALPLLAAFLGAWAGAWIAERNQKRHEKIQDYAAVFSRAEALVGALVLFKEAGDRARVPTEWETKRPRLQKTIYDVQEARTQLRSALHVLAFTNAKHHAAIETQCEFMIGVPTPPVEFFQNEVYTQALFSVATAEHALKTLKEMREDILARLR